MWGAEASSSDSCGSGERRGIRHRASALVLGLAVAVSAGLGLAPSAQADSVPLVQYFYVPLPEEQILTMLQAINAAAVEPITTYVTITAVADGTVIFYDQWENGYDVDLAGTLDVYNASTNPGGTQIWGDATLANGAPPGVTTDGGDVINSGTVVQLESDVTTTTRQAVIDFDGGDKFAASKTIAVTRTSWAGVSGTLFAGCVEVFDTNNWGTDYRCPVGAGAPNSYEMFQYTALSIMAGADGTLVDVDMDGDGNVGEAGDYDDHPLDEGESLHVTGVPVGAHVTSTQPVQVDLFTGDIGSNYESRDSALMPTSNWTDRYYTPVSTADVGDTGDARTTVWLYNGTGSQITVTYERRNTAGATTTTNINVAAGAVVGRVLDDAVGGTGAAFYTSNGANFYAYSTTDSASATTTENQAWDWSFTLIPDDMLTTQALIGLGIGRDPDSGTNPLENGNPVWVTTVGNPTTFTDVYVDYDADPTTGRFTDTSGYMFDAKYSLRELDQARVYVPPTTATGVQISASSSGTNNNQAVSTLTFAHDNSAAAENRLLMVGVAIGNSNEVNGVRQVQTVTFAGLPLTFVGSAAAPVGGGGTPNSLPRVEMWALANPPKGNGNVIVTLTGGRVFASGATTFSGVDVANGLSSALGTFNSASAASGTTQSVGVITSAGQVAYDVVAIGNYGVVDAPAPAVGAGQVSRWAQRARSANSGTRRSVRGAGSTETATGGSTTMSWTTSGSYPWAIGAVPIKPMPAGSVADQTGILLYTLDTSVKLAVAWGQDPWRATAGVPGLDVGTSVPPMPEFQAAKDGVLWDDPLTVGVVDGDVDLDGYLSAGDILEYPITVYNVSRLPVPNVYVWDEIPANTTYEPNSTAIDGVAVPDDTSGTPFPLDGTTGLLVTSSLPVGGEITVTFRVRISDPVPSGTAAIVNGGEGRALGWDDPVGDDAFLRGRISDYVWFDADGDGVQDVGELPIEGVTVRLLDIDGRADVRPQRHPGGADRRERQVPVCGPPPGFVHSAVRRARRHRVHHSGCDDRRHR